MTSAMTPAPIIIVAIRVILLIEAVIAALAQSWPQLLIALATLGLTFLPDRAARFMGVRLPRSFLAVIAAFVFATLFLGEVRDYYERFWWWDIAVHFGSAVSIGVFAFLAIFMLFEGDRYAAPPWAVAFLSSCVALAIGAVWEIFEFAMDQSFGLNMQKSGLVDTMWDLIVDTLGAALAGIAGFAYLKGVQLGLIDEFVGMNRRLYGRIRRRPREGSRD